MSKKFLEDILRHKKALLKRKSQYYFLLGKNLPHKISSPHLFKQRISRPGEINLIAEIKKASPSKGIICKNFDAVKIAQIYVKAKAAAISVLTEETYFLGDQKFVQEIHSRFNIPLLTKDFIIDARQIYEAALNGSSAVLLIVAILDDAHLKDFIQAASSLGLDALVEVHDEGELRRALAAGAEIIGVNNRDLKTFNVDLGVGERLIPKIPKSKIIVAESGISTRQDIARLKELGAHAVLIGEAFMREKDIARTIEDVMHG